MAESSRKYFILNEQLELELTCTICVEYFIEPIILPCSHSFCKKCIESVIRHNGQHVQSFDCPFCRNRIYLKMPNTIDGYPKNLALDNLVKLHTETSSSFPDELFKTVLPKLQFDQKCYKHEEPLCMYCKTCCRTLCLKCATVVPCSQHHVSALQDMCAQFVEQIITVLFDIKQHQNRLDEENCKLKTYFQEIDEHEEQMKSMLTSECDELKLQLNRKYDELKTTLHLKYADLKKLLMKEKKKYPSYNQQIKDMIKLFTETVNETKAARVFTQLKYFDSKIKELNMTLQHIKPLSSLNLSRQHTDSKVSETIGQLTLKAVPVPKSIIAKSGTATSSESSFVNPISNAFASNTLGFGHAVFKQSSEDPVQIIKLNQTVPKAFQFAHPSTDGMVQERSESITENKSLEEQRFEDYQADQKGKTFDNIFRLTSPSYPHAANLGQRQRGSMLIKKGVSRTGIFGRGSRNSEENNTQQATGTVLNSLLKTGQAAPASTANQSTPFATSSAGTSFGQLLTASSGSAYSMESSLGTPRLSSAAASFTLSTPATAPTSSLTATTAVTAAAFPIPATTAVTAAAFAIPTTAAVTAAATSTPAILAPVISGNSVLGASSVPSLFGLLSVSTTAMNTSSLNSAILSASMTGGLFGNVARITSTESCTDRLNKPFYFGGASVPSHISDAGANPLTKSPGFDSDSSTASSTVSSAVSFTPFGSLATSTNTKVGSFTLSTSIDNLQTTLTTPGITTVQSTTLKSGFSSSSAIFGAIGGPPPVFGTPNKHLGFAFSQGPKTTSVDVGKTNCEPTLTSTEPISFTNGEKADQSGPFGFSGFSDNCFKVGSFVSSGHTSTTTFTDCTYSSSTSEYKFTFGGKPNKSEAANAKSNFTFFGIDNKCQDSSPFGSLVSSRPTTISTNAECSSSVNLLASGSSTTSSAFTETSTRSDSAISNTASGSLVSESSTAAFPLFECKTTSPTVTVPSTSVTLSNSRPITFVPAVEDLGKSSVTTPDSEL